MEEIERVVCSSTFDIRGQERNVLIFVWCWWADNAIIMVTFTPVLATLCRAAPGTAR